MRKFDLLTGVLLLAGFGLLLGCETTTDDAAACDPACRADQVCDTAGAAPVCLCAVGTVESADKTACLKTCPTDGSNPCNKYAGECKAGAVGEATCACPAGMYFREEANLCVEFTYITLVGKGGGEPGGQTQGADIDAIGLGADPNTEWCPKVEAVNSRAGIGKVDAAHQKNTAVVGAPDGNADNGDTYFSMGLVNGGLDPVISCDFAMADPAMGIKEGDTLVVAEVTGANAMDEPFEIHVCYDGWFEPAADMTKICELIGAQATGDHSADSKKYTFEVPAGSLAAGTIGAPEFAPAQ